MRRDEQIFRYRPATNALYNGKFQKRQLANEASLLQHNMTAAILCCETTFVGSHNFNRNAQINDVGETCGSLQILEFMTSL
jgi:hypothetical protein